MSDYLKMYIAVHCDVPKHMVPVLVAHSVLSAHATFCNDQLYQTWYKESYRKVVLSVTEKEFAKIANLDKVHQGYENTVFNANPSCIVVCPRLEIPNVLKFAKLWA